MNLIPYLKIIVFFYHQLKNFNILILYMSDKKYGIVGAMGAVGNEILMVMNRRKVKASILKLFVSKSSVGSSIRTSMYGELKYELFNFNVAKELDIIFLCVDTEFALEWGRKLAEVNVIVIDNSSAFRMCLDVPLCIPEINMDQVDNHKLIANPNCTTAIALMALFPIYKVYGLKKVIISTYQSASGAGLAGMQELIDCKGINKVFPYPLQYNIIPHIDEFTSNGYTKEELKVVNEMRKILNTPDLAISCTACRVPTLRSHCVSINIETIKEIFADDVRNLLQYADGVDVVDDVEKLIYPMPISSSSKFNIEVGRIRQSLVFGHHGIDLFVCGDQLLRGSSLNSVIIAENLIL